MALFRLPSSGSAALAPRGHGLLLRRLKLPPCRADREPAHQGEVVGLADGGSEALVALIEGKPLRFLHHREKGVVEALDHRDRSGAAIRRHRALERQGGR